MDVVELTVEARLLNENKYNGYSIGIATPFKSSVKLCFLPIYRMATMSVYSVPVTT